MTDLKTLIAETHCIDQIDDLTGDQLIDPKLNGLGINLPLNTDAVVGHGEFVRLALMISKVTLY